MKDFDGVFFNDICFREVLVVVEVDEIGCSIVLSSLSAFGAVPSEVSHFSALEAGIRGVSCGGRVALEVILWSIPLVAVGVLSSPEVIASIVPSIVSSGWSPVSIYIHGDGGVVHPSRGVG